MLIFCYCVRHSQGFFWPTEGNQVLSEMGCVDIPVSKMWFHEDAGQILGKIITLDRVLPNRNKVKKVLDCSGTQKGTGSWLHWICQTNARFSSREKLLKYIRELFWWINLWIQLKCRDWASVSTIEVRINRSSMFGVTKAWR